MLQERFVKKYFSKKGTISKWWHPEEGIMSHIYAREIDIIWELLQKEPINEILDASCGRGRIAKLLYQAFNVTALDISEEMLKSLKSLDLPRVSMVKGDAENMPFKDNSFDGIVCVKSFVHYPNPQKALNEFYRVLKKNGILIIDIDNKYSLRWFLKNIVIFLHKIANPKFEKIGEGIFVLYSKRDFLNLLSGSGFKIEKISYLGILSPISIEFTKTEKIILLSAHLSKRLESLDKFLENTPLLKKLATYIYVKCRKL